MKTMYEKPIVEFRSVKLQEKVAVNDCWNGTSPLYVDPNPSSPGYFEIRFTLSGNGCGQGAASYAIYETYAGEPPAEKIATINGLTIDKNFVGATIIGAGASDPQLFQ